MFEFIGEHSAIVIAILALVFTVYQGYLTRMHNQLSVKPILAFETLQSVNVDRFTYIVSNRGLGPALVDNIALYYKDEFIGYLDNFDVWDKLGKAFNDNNIDIEGISYSGKFPIKKDEERILVALYYSSDRDVKEQIDDFNQVEFEIIYRSMYNKKYKATRKE